MSKYFKLGLVGLPSILSYSNRELFFIINCLRSIFDVLLQILNMYTSFSKSSKLRVCPLLTCSSVKIPFSTFWAAYFNIVHPRKILITDIVFHATIKTKNVLFITPARNSIATVLGFIQIIGTSTNATRHYGIVTIMRFTLLI